MSSRVAVREMRAADALRVADLSGQLGYPLEPDELAGRIEDLLQHPGDAALFVATDADDHPVGWLQVELKRTLVEELSAQIMALVVDEAARNGGVGRELLAAGEAWAAAHRVRRMLVASRVTRERARRFYERGGYAVLKVSNIFEKRLR